MPQMDVLELIQSGRTQTSFGRHHEKLTCLEEALREARFEEHHTLVIGAGFNFLPFTSTLEGTPQYSNPDLQRPYSWEVVELAAILERQRKPWTITVVDNSSEVCAAVAQQESIIIHDFHSLRDQGMTDYARSVLAAIGERGNDDPEMKAINNALELGSVGNRLSVFKKAKIPQRIKERTNVVQGSVANLSGRLAGAYNVATCFNVMMYLPAGLGDFAAQSLNQAIAERGVIASDTAITGFNPIRTFLDEEKIEGDCGGSYTQIRKRYLLSKQPEL